MTACEGFPPGADAGLADAEGDALTQELRSTGVAPWTLDEDEHVRPLHDPHGTAAGVTAVDGDIGLRDCRVEATVRLPMRLPTRRLGLFRGGRALPRLALPDASLASAISVGPDPRRMQLEAQSWSAFALDADPVRWQAWFDAFAQAWPAARAHRFDVSALTPSWRIQIHVADRHTEVGGVAIELQAPDIDTLGVAIDHLRASPAAGREALALPVRDGDVPVAAILGDRSWLAGDAVIVDAYAWDIRSEARLSSDDPDATPLHRIRVRLARRPLADALSSIRGALRSLATRFDAVAPDGSAFVGGNAP
ncbi:hypothetical protein [Luteimonas sp. FCS-9]|uniref:hypothetical protein n=1 Tax=Luteimonas sp. FCS-9 TaxID=1547516 RepID=UPI000ACEA45C|nr:hypothetical protein [Luteimonas sp. FCS-9]